MPNPKRTTWLAVAAALSGIAMAMAAGTAAAADFGCYCYFEKDQPGTFCRKGEVGISGTFTYPATQTSCEQDCERLEPYSGSSSYYLLSQQPADTYYMRGGDINCVPNFSPPIGFSGSCKAVPEENPSCDGATLTPCNVTIRTDAAPPFNVFSKSYGICANNCTNQGLHVCGDDVFTPAGSTSPAGQAPAPTPVSQGGTSNNQILSGSVLSLTLPLGNVSLPALIGRVIKQLLSIVGALALLYFVWGGFRWMLSRGNPDEVAKAKKMIVAAISGLIAIFTSYAVLDLIIKSVSK